jgi:IS5 family transposase
MGRNVLAHTAGDASNPVLAAAGCNFRRLLTWLRLLMAWIAYSLCERKNLKLSLSWPYFTDDSITAHTTRIGDACAVLSIA